MVDQLARCEHHLFARLSPVGDKFWGQQGRPALAHFFPGIFGVLARFFGNVIPEMFVFFFLFLSHKIHPLTNYALFALLHSWLGVSRWRCQHTCRNTIINYSQ